MQMSFELNLERMKEKQILHFYENDDNQSNTACKEEYTKPFVRCLLGSTAIRITNIVLYIKLLHLCTDERN